MSGDPERDTYHSSPPTGDDAKKHYVPQNVTRAKFIETFQNNLLTKFYPFEDARGQRKCWHLGRQTADEFVSSSGVPVTDEIFHGRTPAIKVFFPIRNTYYVVNPIKLRGKSTLLRVLQAVEVAAVNSYAYHIVHDIGGGDPTVGRIRRLMARNVLCHIMVRRAGGGNHVYVRLA